MFDELDKYDDVTLVETKTSNADKNKDLATRKAGGVAICVKHHIPHHINIMDRDYAYVLWMKC